MNKQKTDFILAGHDMKGERFETGLGCYMVLCFLVTLPSVSTCSCTSSCCDDILRNGNVQQSFALGDGCYNVVGT
jgi:hypothetical protein